MFGTFDQEVFTNSILASNDRIKQRSLDSKARKLAEKKLSEAIMAEADLAAKRLKAQVWPDGAFLARVARWDDWLDRKAPVLKMLHIFGADWDGNINTALTPEYAPLWLAENGKPCTRTHTGSIVADPDRVVPFWQYGESRDSNIVRNRDGVAILATLRALGRL